MGDVGLISYNNFLLLHFQNPTDPVCEDDSASKGGNETTKGGNASTVDTTIRDTLSPQEADITPTPLIYNQTSLKTACLQILVGSAL